MQTPEKVAENLVKSRSSLSFEDFLGYGSVLIGLSQLEGAVSPDVIRNCLDAEAKETYAREFYSVLDLGVPRDLVDLAYSDYGIVDSAAKEQLIRNQARQAIMAVETPASFEASKDF